MRICVPEVFKWRLHKYSQRQGNVLRQYRGRARTASCDRAWVHSPASEDLSLPERS